MRKLKNVLIGTTAAPQSMETQGSDVTETKVTRAKVAEHSLIDAVGAPVDDEESAAGISYKLIENGETFTWSYETASEASRKMLALFGAKTLATNETSQARNNQKGAASADDQIAAVRERFALIDSGTWIDRTRDGVGAKVDKDALAEAVCRVLIEAGKKTQDECDTGYKATVREKLETDATFVRTTRQVPAVAQAYSAIVGRVTKTVDDLLI